MTTLVSAPGLTVDWSSFRDARPRTVSEVLAEAAQVPPFMLDGLIHPSATLLTGPPKVGKSFLVMEWVEALTTGQIWHDRQVHGGPYSVLIMPTDPWGHIEYASRFRDEIGTRVALVDPPRPGDRLAWQRLAEDSAVHGVGLAVLDNLLSYNPTAKINDNGEVGVTLAGLGELGRMGVPYLVVHHSSKGGQSGYIGSTNIGAHFRHLVYLDDRGTLEISGNYVGGSALQLAKGNDGRTVSVQPAEPASRAQGKKGRPSPKAQARRNARDQRIEEAIALLAGMPPEISDRERARLLVGAVDGISREEQGRNLLRNARARLGERASEAAADKSVHAGSASASG